MERETGAIWMSGLEQVVLLQRTRVQLPEMPSSVSQLPITLAPGDYNTSNSAWTCIFVHTNTHTHEHTQCFKKPPQIKQHLNYISKPHLATLSSLHYLFLLLNTSCCCDKTPRSLIEGKVHCGILSVPEGWASHDKEVCWRSRKLRSHIFNHKGGTDGAKWKWGEVMNSEIPALCDTFFNKTVPSPQTRTTTCSNPEPMECFSHSNHHTLLGRMLLLCILSSMYVLTRLLKMYFV